MSNSIKISVDDYNLLKQYSSVYGRAVLDSFGKVTGYMVYDFHLRDLHRIKADLTRSITSDINKINEDISSMTMNYNKLTGDMTNDIHKSFDDFKRLTNASNDYDKISRIFSNSLHEINDSVDETYHKLVLSLNSTIASGLHDLQLQLDNTKTAAFNDLASLKGDIAAKNAKANVYANEYYKQAKEAIAVLKNTADNKYFNMHIIDNLENELKKAESNIQHGMYETAIASSIHVQEEVYEEIYNCEAKSLEYELFYRTLRNHLNSLNSIQEDRKRITKEELDAVNAIAGNSKLSDKLIKKDLRLFSPDGSIDAYREQITKMQEELDTYTLEQLKDITQNQIASLYDNMNKAYNDATVYYANYLERIRFANKIIDKFEDSGRHYIDMMQGESKDCKDFTKPLFLLFRDNNDSEFMIEIYNTGNASNLRSEFHVHKIKGDPYDTLENDITESILKDAIKDGDANGIQSGGCNHSYRNRLSDDPRIKRIRSQM